jgi:hypothetical protein
LQRITEQAAASAHAQTMQILHGLDFLAVPAPICVPVLPALRLLMLYWA